MAERPRIVVAIPDRTESSAVADWLSADGFDAVARSAAKAAAEEIDAREPVLLVADANLFLRSPLQAHLRTRHPQTPAIVIHDPAALAYTAGGGRTTYVERPIDRATLGCFVSMAILDGRPARRSTRKPVNRFEALVNGMPAYLVELSAEGLRLEMSRDSRAVPPYFVLQIPLVGIAVKVRRMWARSSSSRPSTICYGGALIQNLPGTDRAWRQFVDTVPAVDGSALRISS